MTPTIYTHGGDFHVDELVAIALLSTFVFPDQPLDIHRTRDKDKLAQAASDKDIFLIDVGLIHDPSRLNFDHHQSDLVKSWEDGLPMSSCGLIWSWLREEGYLSSMEPEECNRMEQDFIRPIDAHDNGLARWPLAPAFRMYNRPGAAHTVIEAQFAQALSFAKDLVVNQCHQAKIDCRTEASLKEAWEQSQSQGDGIVIVHAQLENRTTPSILARVSGYEANLILYPRSASRKNNHWFIRALPDGENSSRNRVSFPVAWRGQNDAVLDLGENDQAQVSFTHKSGFLGLVEGNLSDAYRVARAILSHPENCPGQGPVEPAAPSQSPRP